MPKIRLQSVSKRNVRGARSYLENIGIICSERYGVQDSTYYHPPLALHASRRMGGGE